jgi:hypothetical protein
MFSTGLSITTSSTKLSVNYAQCNVFDIDSVIMLSVVAPLPNLTLAPQIPTLALNLSLKIVPKATGSPNLVQLKQKIVNLCTLFLVKTHSLVISIGGTLAFNIAYIALIHLSNLPITSFYPNLLN